MTSRMASAHTTGEGSNDPFRKAGCCVCVRDRRPAGRSNGLSRLLADTYLLYVRTHGYRRNVTGARFNTLHLMFEQEYNELALAVDLIAERIRSLGFPAPASYREFARLSSMLQPA